MMNYSELISCREKLRFKNGKFRILILSDIHGVVHFDKRLLRDLNAILDKTKPDLVLLNGDIVWRDASADENTLRDFLTEFIGCMRTRKIPWANVFGNHDEEGGCPAVRQQKVYEEFEGCLSKAGEEDVPGIGNYMLPLYSSDGEKLIFAVWGMDTHRGFGDFLKEHHISAENREVFLPDPMYISQGYDNVRFEQIMWYWNASVLLEKENGRKIPGLLFCHIPLPEFIIPYKNVAETGFKGTRREAVGSGPLNSGLFSALLEREDIKTVVCGHDHINDCEGEYLGIRLAYDAGFSYDGYCDADLRGGRIVDIDESDPGHVATYMIRSSECVAEYPGKEMR